MRALTDDEKEGIRDFVNKMLGLTIRLVQIVGNRPVNVASGFIWQNAGRHTLITVLHSFQPNKDDRDDIRFDGWCLETDNRNDLCLCLFLCQ